MCCNTGMTKKIYTIILGLFLANCIIPGSALGAGEKNKKKKIKYVKSKYGLKALINLGKTRDKMIKVYNKETDNYENIRDAINSGELKKGMTAESVKDDYGPPVIILDKEKDGRVKWVYKSAAEDYFTGEKIYLTFTPDGQLHRWWIVQSKE